MSNRTRFFSFPAGGLMLAGALALPAPLMISCRSSVPPVETVAGFGPGYPAGSAGWSVKEREVYRAAFDAGRRDQKEGYRYDDDRVTVPLKEEMRSFSRQGYRAGYYHQAAVRRAGGGSSAAAVPAAAVPAAGSETSAGNGIGWGFGPGPAPVVPTVPVEPPKPKPKPKPVDPFAVPLEGMGTVGAGEEMR